LVVTPVMPVVVSPPAQAKAVVVPPRPVQAVKQAKPRPSPVPAVPPATMLPMIERPVWAANVGTDQFGTWADLLVQGVTQRMRLIPAGSFQMGSAITESGRSQDEIQHAVTLSQSFWLADSPCTQELWQVVMPVNALGHLSPLSRDPQKPSLFTDDDKRPVEQVSWNDCAAFCQWLNSKVHSLNVLLPTEAQWEYACRAGTTGPYNGDLNATAWYADNAGAQTHPVKMMRPNAWGLFDMHGNVHEWCADWYRPCYGRAKRDPRGPTSGSHRVYRGGSWDRPAACARSAGRNGFVPGFRWSDLGFRLAAPVQ
jgi:formylglycine-generating enzyme required for sulfatase activity